MAHMRGRRRRKVADARKTGETNEGKEGPAATEGAPREEEEGPGGSYMCLNYFVVYLVDFGSWLCLQVATYELNSKFLIIRNL
jgi:hypothetical protein